MNLLSSNDDRNRGKYEEIIFYLKFLYTKRSLPKFDSNVFLKLSNNFVQTDFKLFTNLHEIIKYLAFVMVEPPSNEKDLNTIEIDLIEQEQPVAEKESAKANNKQRALLVPVLVANEADSTSRVTTETSIQNNEDDDDDSIIKVKNIKGRMLNDKEKAHLNKLSKLHKKMMICKEKIKRYDNKDISLRDMNSLKSASMKASKEKNLLIQLSERYVKIVNKYPQLIEKNVSKKSRILRENMKNFSRSESDKRAIYLLEDINFTPYKCLNEKIVEFSRNLKEAAVITDIEKLIQKTNVDYKLCLSTEKCKDYAYQTFDIMVRKTKVKREAYDNDCLFGFYDLGDNEDPSTNNDSLKAKLDRNASESKIKLDNILEDFSNKQSSFDVNDVSDEVDDDDDDDGLMMHSRNSKRIRLLSNDEIVEEAKEQIFHNDRILRSKSNNLPKIANISYADDDNNVIILD